VIGRIDGHSVVDRDCELVRGLVPDVTGTVDVVDVVSVVGVDVGVDVGVGGDVVVIAEEDGGAGVSVSQKAERRSA